jgi:hypothetical protein
MPLSEAERKKMKTAHLATVAKIDAATAKRQAALDGFARGIMDLRPVIAEARGLPLALGPDSRFCDSLVEAGIVKRIGIGSRVMALETKDYGVVTGWTDGNTEVVVRWDNGATSAASAGKREVRWDLAVLE